MQHRKPADEKRSHVGRVPLTLDERAELERRALVAGVSVAEFIRRSALAHEPLALSTAAGISRRA
jgi:hypothetical protein